MAAIGAYGPQTPRQRRRHGFRSPVSRGCRKEIGFTAGLLKEAKALAANPVDTAKLGAGVAGELAYLLLMPEDSWTRFKGKPSGNKRVAWTAPVPLLEVKAVSKALGCTINDILLGSVAGALCDYLKEKGDPTAGVEIRALVPVDMRKTTETGQLGNKFGVAAVELPVGIENPLARVLEVHRRMLALKQSLEPPVTLGLFAALGHAPQILQDRLFNMLMHRATAVMTNVPGPQLPLYLGGAEIKQIMFWVPQSGDIGMGVSILSYNGMVQFGLITDAAMVPDPEAIIANFRPQFEELLYFVLMSPWGAEDTEATGRIGAIAPAARTRKTRTASQKHEEAARIEEAAPAAPARKRRPAPKQKDAELKEAPSRPRLCAKPGRLRSPAPGGPGRTLPPRPNPRAPRGEGCPGRRTKRLIEITPCSRSGPMSSRNLRHRLPTVGEAGNSAQDAPPRNGFPQDISRTRQTPPKPRLRCGPRLQARSPHR